jgi:hypothetical protein
MKHCKGLKKCTHEIIKVSKSEAGNVYKSGLANGVIRETKTFQLPPILTLLATDRSHQSFRAGLSL